MPIPKFLNPRIHPLSAVAAVLAFAYALLLLADFTGYVEPSPAEVREKLLELSPAYRIVPTDSKTSAFLSGAYAQIGVTTGYDPTYRKLDFPMGDVPIETGVCSDVVIRAFRAVGTDLQADVNADMKANFSKYPSKYGLSAPDTNIDHRRVPNLMAYFSRKGWSADITKNPADYLPGDIVAWSFPRNQTHIGIVSDRIDTVTGVPLIINNEGRGTLPEDILFGYPIIGHYRR